MRTRLLTSLARVNDAHPWSHNAAYEPFVLREAKRARRGGATNGLDVGCGTGGLLRKLAHVLAQVTGVEADPVTATKAVKATNDLANVEVVNGSFPMGELHQFDFVSAVAVLHHFPLAEGIRTARDAVSPGGRLVIVGCYREEPGTDWFFAGTSLLLNPLIGLVLRPRRTTQRPEAMTAPAVEAADSYPAIRETLRSTLPGAKVRRGLFWRYVAVWVAPPA